MGNFIAEITVMPLSGLLDPPGKAVLSTLKTIGFHEINHVRVGKQIVLEMEADSEQSVHERVQSACEKLLVNALVEGFEIKITRIL